MFQRFSDRSADYLLESEIQSQKLDLTTSYDRLLPSALFIDVNT